MRLIDADDLLTAFPLDDEPTVTKSCLRMTIKHMPTIDAEPIRHGHWEHGEDVFGMYCQCSECGNQYYGSYEFKYCPNCGAKMDEVEERREDVRITDNN